VRASAASCVVTLRLFKKRQSYLSRVINQLDIYIYIYIYIYVCMYVCMYTWCFEVEWDLPTAKSSLSSLVNISHPGRKRIVKSFDFTNALKSKFSLSRRNSGIQAFAQAWTSFKFGLAKSVALIHLYIQINVIIINI
jgi:hypothetical protein